MSGIGAGMKSAIALSMYGAAVVLVMITGVTDMNLGYSEALLVFGGASIALLGGTILPERPAIDRRTGLLMFALGMVATVWVFWIRDHFDLTIQSTWHNRYFKDYKPLLQPDIPWLRAASIFIASFVSLALLMHGLKIIWRRFVLASHSNRKSGIRWMIVLAVLLYGCFLIQSRLISTDGDSDNIQTEPYILPALVLIGAMIMPTAFFLPQRSLFAWLWFFAIGSLAFGLEVLIQNDFDRMQGIAAICLLGGFVLTGCWLRPRRESSVDQPVQVNTSFKKMLHPAIPGMLLILVGWVTVFNIDVGRWASTGNLNLARKIAFFRRLDTQMELGDSRNSRAILRIGSKAPSNILELALDGVPPGTFNVVHVWGMRPDIDIVPVKTGMPRGAGGGGGFLNDGLRLESGSISASQICKILETCDLSIGDETTVVRGDEIRPDEVDRNSLQLMGTADSIVQKLNQLEQCNSLYSLILILYGDSGYGQYSVSGDVLLEGVLNNVKGKNLNFIGYCNFRGDEIVLRDGLPQWESISINMMQQDWRTGLSLAILNERDTLKVVYRGRSDPVYVDTPEYAAMIRGALATNGRIDVYLDWKQLAGKPDLNLEDCFGRFDCILEFDDQGNPVSVLALFPEFLSVLDKDQAPKVKSILIGSEWGNIVPNSISEFDSIPASLLDRFGGLTRLYMGSNRIDDYSFLKKMPELRDLQVAEETAAERIADLIANLQFVPKLERFLTTGMPEKSLARQLGSMPALKEVVLFGLEIRENDGSALEPLRKLIPGVTIRVQPEFSLATERPADLIEHQKRMLKRLAEELKRPANSESGK